jgi:hypothetical protein
VPWRLRASAPAALDKLEMLDASPLCEVVQAPEECNGDPQYEPLARLNSRAASDVARRLPSFTDGGDRVKELSRSSSTRSSDSLDEMHEQSDAGRPRHCDISSAMSSSSGTLHSAHSNGLGEMELPGFGGPLLQQGYVQSDEGVSCNCSLVECSERNRGVASAVQSGVLVECSERDRGVASAVQSGVLVECSERDRGVASAVQSGVQCSGLCNSDVGHGSAAASAAWKREAGSNEGDVRNEAARLAGGAPEWAVGSEKAFLTSVWQGGVVDNAGFEESSKPGLSQAVPGMPEGDFVEGLEPVRCGSCQHGSQKDIMRMYSEGLYGRSSRQVGP